VSEKSMTQQQAGLVRRAKMSRRNPADLAGVCSGGKFVVLRAGRAYDAPVRGPTRKFRLTLEGNQLTITGHGGVGGIWKRK
jgi:hypothetical protein